MALESDTPIPVMDLPNMFHHLPEDLFTVIASFAGLHVTSNLVAPPMFGVTMRLDVTCVSLLLARNTNEKTAVASRH